MKPVILARISRENEEEFSIASDYLDVKMSRVGLSNSLVIGRYSVLPFYRELEADLACQGSRLINSFKEHDYIASFDYYEDVKEFTPKTWFTLSEVDKKAYPFIVKGRTNSRKNEWLKLMYAANYNEAARIYCDLSIDPLIQDQGVIVRQWEEFVTLERGVNGQPFLNEWRFFFLGQKMLAYGFYWTQCETQGTMDADGLFFANKIAKIISQKTNFFVLDIAQKSDGSWRLIEVNDGQMSGLSDIDPHILYSNILGEYTNANI